MAAFADFWSDVGEEQILPYLDLASFTSLGATAELFFRFSQLNWPDAWHVSIEVSAELRFAARSRARTMCASERHMSSVAVVDVTLPKRSVFQGLPRRIAEASSCGSITFDFRPVVLFQRRCSHTTELTADPWQPVVLRISVAPDWLDEALKTAYCVAPQVKKLQFESMPATAITKRIAQDDPDQPMAFPVLRQLPRFTNLQVLIMESDRSHPNNVSVISMRAFEHLTSAVLPFMKLEELSMSPFLVEDIDRPGRSSSTNSRARSAMKLEPFLKLSGLRRLRLNALRASQPFLSQVRSVEVGPLVLDLTSLPLLEELDLSFLPDGTNGSFGLSSPNDVLGVEESLGKNLRSLRLRGIGSGGAWLRPQLARRLATCRCLEVLELQGATLPEEFLAELAQGLENSVGRHVSSGLRVVCTWEEPAPRKGFPRAQPPTPGPGCGHLMKVLQVQRGCLCLETAGVVLDLRMPVEEAANHEQVATGGLPWYGQGMEWFLGGEKPPALTTFQSSTINHRYTEV